MSSGDARAPDRPTAPSSAPYAAWSAWTPSQAAGITLLIVAASMAAGLAVTVALAGSRDGSTAPRDAAVVLGLATSQLVMIGGALWAAYHRDGAALPVLSLRAPVQGPRAYPMAMVILIGLITGLSAILAGTFWPRPDGGSEVVYGAHSRCVGPAGVDRRSVSVRRCRKSYCFAASCKARCGARGSASGARPLWRRRFGLSCTQGTRCSGWPRCF